MTEKNTNIIERGPIVAIMGHIDHGKSTLLSYIRKSTEPLNEAGGITQHISAYEVEHTTPENKKNIITFLDTPGHEAFCGIRQRGATIADIVILVVSAEDGVKPQTLEALKCIKDSNTPFIIAINKIDRPEANIERTKQNLAENEIYLEGYGGDVPVVCLSAKTGEGVSDLLDMIILVAEMEELKGDTGLLASGMIIESNRDIKKGISATCIIKNGFMEKGMFITSGTASAPLRIIENYLGKQIDKALFPSPVKIIGWDELPIIGDNFETHKTREEAKEKIEKEKSEISLNKKSEKDENKSLWTLSAIVKADTGSSLEAVLGEIKKLNSEKTGTRVISSGIGNISENDIQSASGKDKAIVIGFNVKIDSTAKNLAERNEIETKTFDIIYKMKEWLNDVLIEKTPKEKITEILGKAKVLKIFSKIKDKQILGARIENGSILMSAQVKIFRRDELIGEGKIRELQQQKVHTNEVDRGEFGSMIVSNTEILEGDKIESYIITEK